MPQESLRYGMEKLPDKGIYALFIRCKGEKTIKIGALGNIFFPAGYYVYIGSAQRNLQRRIGRHLRKMKKLHWHIDYLLRYTDIVGFHAVSLPKEYEELISLELSKKYGFILNFGSSDSSAPSHLFYSKNPEIFAEVEKILNKIYFCAED